MDPFCRRHHRGKTFAWLACIRDDHGVDWTMPDAEHYRCIDEPLPTGRPPEGSEPAGGLNQLTHLQDDRPSRAHAVESSVNASRSWQAFYSRRRASACCRS